MRFNSSGEAACDADVQRAVRFVGEDVDDWLLHAWSNVLAEASLTTNKNPNGVPAFAGTTESRRYAFSRTCMPVRAESSCTITPSMGSTSLSHGARSIMRSVSARPACQ